MQTTILRSLTAKCAVALFAGLFTFASVSDAGTLNHGDYMGDNVEYLDVTETSADPLPLYGAPTVSGDTLAFFEVGSSNPSLGFNAISTDGPGALTDGFLSLAIESKSSSVGIDTIQFSEGGDYTMSGIGSTAALVSATLNVFELLIMEVDGAPITPISLSALEGVSYELPADPTSGNWYLSAGIDLTQALVDAGQSYTYGVTRLTAKVNNTLTALSQPGSVAGIFKKDFDIDIETRVPEPTTLVLAAFGVIGILAKRRTA